MISIMISLQKKSKKNFMTVLRKLINKHTKSKKSTRLRFKSVKSFKRFKRFGKFNR